MAFAFDSHRFGQVLHDAEGIAARAIDLEHQLSLLVDKTDQSGAPRQLLDSVRSACIAARAHRQLTETLVARLLGSGSHGSDARRPARILIVDDSPDNLDLVAQILEASGFEAITASNGLEALIVAHYARPALILMDLTMPVLSGLEAARVLKSSPATQDINVIAYTARPDFYQPPFTKFFVEVLPKPSPPEKVLASVQRFLGD
jgi:CheY-like chemotaxis protein